MLKKIPTEEALALCHACSTDHGYFINANGAYEIINDVDDVSSTGAENGEGANKRKLHDKRPFLAVDKGHTVIRIETRGTR